MIKKSRLAAIAITNLLLISCASKQPITAQEPIEPPKPKWTAESCQQTDWYHLGRSQGYDGKVDINITEIADDCAEAGIQINTQAYFEGLREAGDKYCTPIQGRTMGQQGKPYPNLCQPAIYSEFHYEWYKSLQQYCHASALNQSRPLICTES